ncbi:MAG: hypothetical protein WB952_05340 [Terriglobales bacterium]
MAFEPILPRPIVPIEPRPLYSAEKGMHEQDGFTQADVLLKAIVLEARKPETLQTRSALRALILRFNCEHGLDF